MKNESVKIVEVGPRDGLQNETKILSVDDRVEFIQKLAGAGLKFLEGGSFVSPKAIPQMMDSEKVWEKIKNLQIDASFLVANEKGFDRALQAGVKSIAVFTATSDSFTQKNINQNVAESLATFAPIVEHAKKSALHIRGYISTVFGCPYEGDQNPDRAVEVAEKLFSMGCEEVSIGDTIGVAHPTQIEKVFGLLARSVGLKHLAGHFHDTRGMAALNIKTALDLGLRIFDSSIGGLGGCPYAPGSAGNVATEEVVWLLEGLGFHTGISLEEILKIIPWIEEKIERSLKAKLYLSKPKHLYYA